MASVTKKNQINDGFKQPKLEVYQILVHILLEALHSFNICSIKLYSNDSPLKTLKTVYLHQMENT